MMKVFLDTNIALDFFMHREDFFEEARAVMALGYNGYCELLLCMIVWQKYENWLASLMLVDGVKIPISAAASSVKKLMPFLLLLQNENVVIVEQNTSNGLPFTSFDEIINEQMEYAANIEDAGIEAGMLKL